ncbi:MAG: glycosyltransferase family 4 protein [Candidatus Omnitrophota bacterium]
MKKILFAIGYSAQLGGGQKVFVTTIKELLKMGCQITVILPDKSLASFLKSLDIKIYIIDFRSIKCLASICKILKESDFDIINTYLPKCSLLVSFVNLFYRRPICCTLLNAIIHEKLNWFQKNIYPLLYFILSKMCDGFIVNSEHNKQHFMKVSGIDGNFIKVIYSGIDLDEFMNVPEEVRMKGKLVLGYVGRLSPEKGPDYLLKSLAYLKDINYECLIVGDGPMRGELEKYAVVNGLGRRVKFLGYQDEIARFINKMDIVVVPSLNETFGLTIIETFALKKPVIASNVGGIPEVVIQGVTGFLFPAKDPLALSECVLRAYNNKEEIKVMGSRAYEYVVQNFSSSIMAKNTFDYLKTLV